MATAAIYIRVSTEEQAKKGYSIEEQETVGRELAKKLGVVGDPIVLIDDGVTGSVLERPKFQELLAIAESVDYVICKDPDRFARKLVHQLIATEKIERAGAKLKFVDFELSPTPEGQLFYTIRGAISEFERAKIVQRLMSGKWRKAQKGGVPTRLSAYGYVQTAKGIEIEPSEAAVVRQVFDWFIHGWEGQPPPGTFNGIAEKLNAMGIRGKQGGRWWPSSIHNMITSTTYNGRLYVRRYNAEGEVANRFVPPERRVRRTERPRDQWIEVPIPAIIDDVTWAESQRMYRLMQKIRPQAPRVRQYLLSGLCVCGRCGSAVVGTSHKMAYKSGPKRRAYYLCKRRSHYGGSACDLPLARAPEVEEAVWEQVGQWIRDPGLLVEAATKLEELAEPRENPVVLEEALQKVKLERQRLLRLYQTGLVPDDEINESLLELKSRESVLRERLAKTTGPDVRPNPSAVEQLIARIEPLWHSTSFEDRQEVVRKLIERIVFVGKAGPRRRDKYIINIVPRVSISGM